MATLRAVREHIYQSSKMTKYLKCNSCNIVINEILTFIDCKIQVMDNESLIRLCRTSFSTREIEEAKSLLFESVQTDKRKISRRNDGKAERDLQDIITVLKETDPEKIPLFAARELHRLPPVTFDHIDATRLLKDILVLREELTKLRADCVTKDELQEALCSKGKTASTSPQWQDPISSPEYRPMNINTKRGAYLDSFQLDSGPIGIVNIDKSCIDSGKKVMLSNKITSSKITSTPKTFYPLNNRLKEQDCGRGAKLLVHPQSLPQTSELKHRSRVEISAGASSDHRSNALHSSPPAPPPLPLSPPPAVSLSQLSHDVNKDKLTQINTSSKEEQKTLAEIVDNGKQWKPENVNQGWIEVQRKRLRNRFTGKTGSALNKTGNFKAAESKVPLLVYNVAKEVKDVDIREYIYRKTGEKISLYKMKTRHEKSYDSYKIFVAKSKLTTFLDDKLWPTDVRFRQFVNFEERAHTQPHR